MLDKTFEAFITIDKLLLISYYIPTQYNTLL